MGKGAFPVIACGSLAAAACSAPSLQVRAIPDPAAKLRNGADLIGNAQTMLALNNVGVALEGFRKAEIEQPENPDVYAGLAACYAAMRRYDLASTYYQRALAYAPHSRKLLRALADAVERQGDTSRAIAIRAEFSSLAAAPTAGARVGSITVELPPLRPDPRTTSRVVSAPAPPPVAMSATVSAAKSLPGTKEAAEAPARAKMPQLLSEAAQALPISPAAVAPHPRAAVVSQNTSGQLHAESLTADRPRLERLSLGEVALVTGSARPWDRRVPSSPARVTWLPIQPGPSAGTIQLLNAARSRGLAAWTRHQLADRGWKRLAVGDYSRVRRHSLVVYSAGYGVTARRLAAQLDCKSVEVPGKQKLVVLLGRDAESKKRLAARL